MPEYWLIAEELLFLSLHVVCCFSKDIPVHNYLMHTLIPKNATKLISMIRKLNGEEKLPAIVFVFSKKTLNTLADKSAENLNLVTPNERK